MGEPASTVVVVGASAGGVEAPTTLAGGLPGDLDVAVRVVLHLRDVLPLDAIGPAVLQLAPSAR